MILQALIKFFFGISIIGFILWNRFIRQRKEVILQNINLEIFQVLFISTIILLFALIVYLSLKKVLKRQTKPNVFMENQYVQKILKGIQEYISSSPQFLYVEVTKNMGIIRILQMSAFYFEKYFYYPHIIGIGLLHVPRVIVATMFLVDIIYFNKLNYFFMSLNLLIPLIITKVLWFIVEDYSNRKIAYLHLYLSIRYTDESKQSIAIDLKSPDQLPKEGYSYEEACILYPYFIEWWKSYHRINNYMVDIEAIRVYYDPYFQLYTSSCFLIGWLAYLCIMLV